MSAEILTLLIAIGAVALMVVGLSITLMVKGHHIQSEVGDNENMKKLGLKCASREMMEEERALGRIVNEDLLSCGATCGTCDTSCSTEEKK